MMNSWIPDGSPIARPMPLSRGNKGATLLNGDAKEAAEALRSVARFLTKMKISKNR